MIYVEHIAVRYEEHYHLLFFLMFCSQTKWWRRDEFVDGNLARKEGAPTQEAAPTGQSRRFRFGRGIRGRGGGRSGRGNEPVVGPAAGDRVLPQQRADESVAWDGRAPGVADGDGGDGG